MVKTSRRRKTQESTSKHSNTMASEVRKVVVGDTGFADDTAILGREEEVHVAEVILEQTCKDWDEKMHPGKTERLRMSGTKRKTFDVRGPGEVAEAKHVGCWVSEGGGQARDTRHRAGKGWTMVRKIAGAWSLGSKRGRGRESGVSIATRLQVMRQAVVPGITSFARSRAWNSKQIAQIERVAKYAVRRAMGMDIYAMKDHHVSDAMMYQASGWNTMADTVRRLTLDWVGHIARMPVTRRPKQMPFWLVGWSAE
jgi:hypothetical protein